MICVSGSWACSSRKSGRMSAAKKEKAPAKQVRRPPKVVWANLTNTHYLSVRQCMEDMGFRITESTTKNMILWCDGPGTIEMASQLEPWQFYNHFPGIWSIARKVELARNLERMAKLQPNVYTFHPRTFLLPGQFGDMKSYMLSIPKRTKRTMIVKPDKGSQGKGIQLIQAPDVIDDYFEAAVAQQYISPFLIDGYKFDLRIYVLVTSVDPLRMYIHNEGMARFCSEKYQEPKNRNLDQAFSHLTNYSLNKKNENFVQNENPDEADRGSKRSLTSVYREIEKMGHSVVKLQQKIDDIMRLTLASVQPFLASNYHTAVSYNDGKSRCFEILGFDIMIDKKMDPWLIEVNCMPSLTCDSPFDTSLKFSVIKGTLKILALNPNFKRLTLAHQKAVTQKRISGTTDIAIRELFDPEVESKIAASTNWRQLYPIVGDQVSSMIMESALAAARDTPVGAAGETAASRARKEAVLAKIREKEIEATEAKRRKRKRPPFQSDFPVSSTPTSKPPRPQPLPRITSKQQPRTPKSAMKPISVRYAPPTHDEEAKLSSEMKDLPPMLINDSEERSRQKRLAKQVSTAQTMSMLTKIKTIILAVAPRPPQTEPTPAPQPIPVRQTRPSKQVVRPVVTYRQVVIDDTL